MNQVRYAEIDGVVEYIHRNLHEPLPLAQLASYVGYSQFHFTRIFKEQVGLPPLYYVSSLRLQKAKDLLLHTNLSIRDIGLEIGQQSLGTFTTRFTDRVGVTPSAFRSSGDHANNHLDTLRKLNGWSAQEQGTAISRLSRVEGTVCAEIPFEGIILIGLFAKPIPEGFPLYGTLLFSLGDFCFTDVKPGTYYIMATSLSWNTGSNEILVPKSTLRTRSREPVIVEANRPAPRQQVMLHPPRIDDPPILISLPLLMNHFLSRIFGIHNG